MNAPYRESLSHILLMSNIIRCEPEINYLKFVDRYGFYTDGEITEMRLLEGVKNAAELRFAINNVKSFLSRSLGAISVASKGVFGSNSPYDGYIDSVRDGLSAWSEVISQCDEFVSGLEKNNK